MRRRHEMPFGAEVVDEGVRFAIWAPNAESVEVVVDGAGHPMPAVEGGWRRALVPEARPGSRYGFRIDGEAETVPDPASRFQPDDVGGLSAVVDPAAYAWADDGWRGRPWTEAVICEVHVGTATEDGTFAALADRLETIRDTGFTAVELMPLSDFAGTRNWGYDGVLPYAPDSSYGTPDDLKHLVDRAHRLGLMVFLDVVYNHFGPAGNYLHRYARSFFTERHQTPWGAGLNFDGREGRAVRDYFLHNALYWIEEYHLDGLRFDAVHAIQDDSEETIVAEIGRRIREATPDRHVHLVLENEANATSLLARTEDCRPQLYDAQWCDDIHHAWHVVLTGETEGYYEDFADRPVDLLARGLAEGFVYQGETSRHSGRARGEPSSHLPPSSFVAFLQNHDQIGNRAAGERLTELVPPERLALARAGLLLAPQIPLMFMGEDWGATAPFQFFVDFSDDAELSRLVREGRQREFRHFAAFANGAAPIPDPTEEATFRRAILDWSEAGRMPHATVLAETKRLLALRRERVVPLTTSAYRGSSSTVAGTLVDISWRFDAGTLRLVANCGDEAAHPLPAAGETIWVSDALISRHDLSSGQLPHGAPPLVRREEVGRLEPGAGDDRPTGLSALPAGSREGRPTGRNGLEGGALTALPAWTGFVTVGTPDGR